MYKRLLLIISILLIICFILSIPVYKTPWKQIYLKAIWNGEISTELALEVWLIDINNDGIPEIAVKNLDYNADIYSIVAGHFSKIGYISLQNLMLWKNRYTGQLEWINTYRYWYKYGTIDYLDKLEFTYGKINKTNILKFNNGTDRAYWKYYGKEVSRLEYQKQYQNFCYSYERVEYKKICISREEFGDENKTKAWLSSWDTDK